MSNVMVTTSVSQEVYRDWKQSGMKLNQLVRMGLMAVHETPGYVERIKALEEGNARLQRKLTALSQSLEEVH